MAQVLHRLHGDIRDIGLNTWQLRTLYAIKKCRTAALGGHIDACDDCGNLSISYNSCRNRHCPKRQGKNREDWVRAREGELLPVPYFHVVFTLPEAVNALGIHDPKLVYGLLFGSVWETLSQFGKGQGVQMGMIAILHTWGQNLGLHPHLHCIVPGGGPDKNGNWKNIRADGKFLFSVKAMSKVFRARYCGKLKNSAPIQYGQIRQQLWQKPWVVFAKRPFGSPKSVVEYLGRYSHKIAISNHRIKAMDEKSVTFDYKDYGQQGFKKQMTLGHREFIRRFAMHILPKGFVKIRHYGFLSSTWKRLKLKIIQSKLQVQAIIEKATVSKIRKCPCCKNGSLHRILVFDQRGPPERYIGMGQITTSCKNQLVGKGTYVKWGRKPR